MKELGAILNEVKELMSCDSFHIDQKFGEEYKMNCYIFSDNAIEASFSARSEEQAVEIAKALLTLEKAKL